MKRKKSEEAKMAGRRMHTSTGPGDDESPTKPNVEAWQGLMAWTSLNPGTVGFDGADVIRQFVSYAGEECSSSQKTASKCARGWWQHGHVHGEESFHFPASHAATTCGSGCANLAYCTPVDYQDGAYLVAMSLLPTGMCSCHWRMKS